MLVILEHPDRLDLGVSPVWQVLQDQQGHLVLLDNLADQVLKDPSALLVSTAHQDLRDLLDLTEHQERQVNPDLQGLQVLWGSLVLQEARVLLEPPDSQGTRGLRALLVTQVPLARPVHQGSQALPVSLELRV